MSPILKKLRLAYQVVRHLGVAWILFRLRYAIAQRVGRLRRRYPVKPWSEVPVREEREGDSSPVSEEALRGLSGDSVLAAAERIQRGEFWLFSSQWMDLGKFPDWHRNPWTGLAAPQDQHWSRISETACGDIKQIWEVSRFPWAFTLARAYAFRRDDACAERFWELFEDWMERNPPNAGVHWRCGQEAAFRLFAAIFAGEVFRGSPRTTDERLRKWRQFVFFTGERIEANLAYALSQKNNHGISECVGLITAGLFFRECPESSRWLSRGWRALERQLDGLVYADGAFVQHSLVYHRVLLDNLSWCVSRCASVGLAVPESLRNALRRALDFLLNLTDPETGWAPLFGPNDGAWVLPWADTDFLDFRPALQCGYAVLGEPRPFPPGPWDEGVAYLTSPGNAANASEDRVDDEISRKRFYASNGGYFMDRVGRFSVFVRCPERFTHRPKHVDMLHAEVLLDGSPVTLDAGSYSYHDRGRFQSAFRDAANHNVVFVPGHEPMVQVGKFLRLPWPRSTCHLDEGRGGLEMTFHGYENLGLSWKRSYHPGGDGEVKFADQVRFGGSAGAMDLRAHWLLVDADWSLSEDERSMAAEIQGKQVKIDFSGSTIQRIELIRASHETSYGWWSPHYNELREAVSVLVHFSVEDATELKTSFSLS